MLELQSQHGQSHSGGLKSEPRAKRWRSRRIVTRLAACAACLGAPLLVFAQPRPAPPPPPRPRPALDPTCTGPAAARQKLNGQRLGERTGAGIWRAMGRDCFELEAFIERVSAIDPPAARRSCLMQGFVTGLDNAMDQVENECSDQCLDEGESFGRSLGRTFCELPPESFLRQGVPLCTVFIAVTCNVSFDTFVQDNCADKVADPAFAERLEDFRTRCDNVGL